MKKKIGTIATALMTSLIMLWLAIPVYADVNIIEQSGDYPVFAGPGYGGLPHITASVWTGDINGDGYGETVVEKYNHMFLYDQSGAMLWHAPLASAFHVPPKMPNPMAGNIAGDSAFEVVFGDKGSSKLYVWDSEGNVIAGFPRTLAGTIHSTPALADIDGDGYLEIAIGCDGNRLYLVEGDGNDLPGWPVSVGGMIRSQPAFGDIDNDGELEIIVSASNYDGNRLLFYTLYAFNLDGTDADGWPKDIKALYGGVGTRYNFPAIGDLDGDGIDEVVIATTYEYSNGGKVIAFDGDGTELWTGSTYMNPYSSPVIGNIDDDPEMEVVVGALWRVYAYENDGTSKWVKSLGYDYPQSAVRLADITDDGVNEIFLSTKKGVVHGWYGDGTPFMQESTGSAIRGSPSVYDTDSDSVFEVTVGAESGYLHAWKLFTDNEQYEMYLETLDDAPPGIDITGVSEEAFYNTDVAAVIEINEANPDIQSLTLNGVPYTSGTVLSGEGYYTLVVTATDRLGNYASKTVNFTIDKTPPVITGTITSLPNDNWWYNTDVTVQFTATDDISGVDTVSPDVIVSTEGEELSVRGIATDRAGNVATVIVPGINIDKTPPAITGNAAALPNKNGWYGSDVTVRFTATDEISGIDTVTPDVNIATEGADQSVAGTATDLAGNTATVTVAGINIDMTPPALTGDATAKPNENGWYRSDVQVRFTATDDISGIDTVTPDVNIATEGADQSVTGTATDLAGNTATVTVDGINIDKIPPVVAVNTPVNDGIYTIGMDMDVYIGDSLSGVASENWELDNTISSSQPTIASSESTQLEPGVYYLTIGAMDAAGNAYESEPVFFVVYDADGSFATGGGSIYPDYESTFTNIKADLNFVAKYQKGVSAGNLKFNYHDADFDFKAENIDWLVVSGSSAQIMGTGTINGDGLYTFWVTVQDSDNKGDDYFSIDIWEGTDIYDEPYHTAKNVLQGGSIEVHGKNRGK